MWHFKVQSRRMGHCDTTGVKRHVHLAPHLWKHRSFHEDFHTFGHAWPHIPRSGTCDQIEKVDENFNNQSIYIGYCPCTYAPALKTWQWRRAAHLRLWTQPRPTLHFPCSASEQCRHLQQQTQEGSSQTSFPNSCCCKAYMHGCWQHQVATI